MSTAEILDDKVRATQLGYSADDDPAHMARRRLELVEYRAQIKESFDDEIDRIKARRDYLLETQDEKLTHIDNFFIAMHEEQGVKRVDYPACSITVAKSPGKVVLEEGAEDWLIENIPTAVKAEVKPKLAEIKKRISNGNIALDDGELIDLENSPVKMSEGSTIVRMSK